MNDYSIENLISFVEILPLNQINFASMRSFLGTKNTSQINHIGQIVTSVHKHTCHHCNKVAKNRRFNMVPVCNLIEKLSVIQVTGLKPLCQDCFGMHGILLKALQDEKDFTAVNSYSVVIKNFKDYGGCSISDITDTLTALMEDTIKFHNTSFKWDLRYLFRRNIVDKPFVNVAVDNENIAGQTSGKKASQEALEEAGFADMDDLGEGLYGHGEAAASSHFDESAVNSDAGNM